MGKFLLCSNLRFKILSLASGIINAMLRFFNLTRLYNGLYLHFPMVVIVSVLNFINLHFSLKTSPLNLCEIPKTT